MTLGGAAPPSGLTCPLARRFHRSQTPQSRGRAPVRPTTHEDTIAWEARCRHSGVACSIPAGGHGMLTMVLAPVDRSRSGGSEEKSNPLRIANARSADQ